MLPSWGCERQHCHAQLKRARTKAEGMLTAAYRDRCGLCSGKVIDLEDEMVCSSCGMVSTKETIDEGEGRTPQAIDYTTHALGSFLGPLDYSHEERFSVGFSKASSTFKYLKTISDYSYKDGASVYACAKAMERVCEKLSLPKAVIGQAVTIAKRVMEVRRKGSGCTIAAVSAFSIIAACRVCGVTTVGTKEVLEAHKAMGHRVKASSIIQVSIESPVRSQSTGAEDYVARVIGRLPTGRLPPPHPARLHEIAKKVLGFIEATARGGHNPRALAACGVYAAEVILARVEERKKLLTQGDVAACAGVAEYTVREQYGEIFRPRMEEIFVNLAGAIRCRGQTKQTYPIPPQPRSRLS